MSDFNFFAEGYLIKGGDPKKGIRVGGIFATENTDVDGEQVVPIDWGFFDKGFGKIKYEHTEFKGPKAIIGFPLMRRKEGKKHYFEGELIPFDPSLPEDKLTPQQRLAKETYTLLGHIEDHNKKHPEKPQKAGWSIEGQYIKNKSLQDKGKVGARVVDIVFTTQPRNMETYATIIKSLSTGDAYALTPEAKTGWAVLRKESIDGLKETQTNSKEKKMLFKNKHDVYKSCRDGGKTHEEALAEAKKWEEDERKSRSESYGAAEKSLQTAKDKLQKSLKDAQDVEAVEVELDVKDLKKSYEKSLQKSLTADKDGNYDPSEFIQSVGENLMAIVGALPSIVKKVDGLAKSLTGFIESESERISADDFLRKSVATHSDELYNLTSDLAILNQQLKNGFEKLAGTGLSSDKIQKSGKEKTEIVDPDKDPDSVDEAIGKLAKSQKVEMLMKLSDEKKISTDDVIKYENSGYMSPDTYGLFKSYAKESLKL